MNLVRCHFRQTLRAKHGQSIVAIAAVFAEVDRFLFDFDLESVSRIDLGADADIDFRTAHFEKGSRQSG